MMEFDKNRVFTALNADVYLKDCKQGDINAD